MYNVWCKDGVEKGDRIMMEFEVINELTLKVRTSGNSVLYTKQGAFIGGSCHGERNYKFEKVLFDTQSRGFAAIGRNLMRRVTGENLPLMKVESRGDNVLYYANEAQHVLVYQLGQGETISVESENILAFTSDCDYSVRFLAQGVVSQKGLATSTLKGKGPEAYVAILVDGNPLVLRNIEDGSTICTDPDATVCWIGDSNSDPEIKFDTNWKTFIGQSSGETYMFEWRNYKPVTVIVQPNERGSGVQVSMDGGSHGSRPNRQSFSIGGFGS